MPSRRFTVATLGLIVLFAAVGSWAAIGFYRDDQATGAPDPAQSSVLTNEDIMEISVGDVPPGTTLTRRVAVTNHTSEPVSVSQITSSCGCLETKAECSLATPGTDIVIATKLKTPTGYGEFAHVLYLNYRGTPRGITRVIRFTGRVGAWIKLPAPSHEAGEVIIGERGETALAFETIVPWASSAGVTVDSPWISLKRTNPLTDLNRHVYSVTVAPPVDSKPGSHSFNLVAPPGGDGTYQVTFPLHVRLVPLWEAVPDRVVVDTVAATASSIPFTVTVRRRTGGEVRGGQAPAVACDLPSQIAHVVHKTEGGYEIRGTVQLGHQTSSRSSPKSAVLTVRDGSGVNCVPTRITVSWLE